MLSYFKRLRFEIEDWLRYQPRVRRAICRWKLWRTRGTDAHAIAALCAAARLAEDDALERRIQERIAALADRLDLTKIDWTDFMPDYRAPRVHKAAVLKPYLGPSEKGVVYIAFENQWVKLFTLPNLRDFSDRYTLVAAPSSSPHNLVNYVLPRAFPDTIFSLIGNAQDLEVIPRVSCKYVVLPLHTSHWVNPELFQPLPKSERSYDLLMVASWGKVKRHQAFFAALRSMPKEFRVLLVGQEQEGRTAETVCELARWYGVQDRFTILSNQPHSEVRKLFAQARASVVLSKREGSCVAIAESMFADTPAAIFHGAFIGSRDFINEQTGRFLDEHNLAHDLTEFVQNADRYSPRAWAETHISCWHSTQALNEALKQHALARGQAWTEDIAALQWSPDPILARPEDRRRLAPEREEIRQRFTLEIGPPPLE